MPRESSPVNKIKWLIIGAGPTGIGATYRLKDLGEQDYLVLESSSQVGGLATSYTDANGFVWDIGGHVQFSHYDYFDQAMLEAFPKEEWLYHQRESWVWIKDRFVPYPFQNNLHHLDEIDRENCLKGLEETQSNKHSSPTNFKEWLEQSFGRGLCQLFLHPYNYKVWAYHPEKLSYSWIGERVAQVDLERIRQNIKANKDDVSWGPNTTFQFPLKGGTGGIWNSLASKIGLDHFSLNQKVISIEPDKKKVILNNREIEYENLLSTMPIDLLTDTIKPHQKSISNLAKQLKHSSSHIFGIGLEGELPASLKGKCWMYFPEDNCPFYRVTVFSHYSPNNVPQRGQFSLMAEVSESPDKKVDRENLMEEVIQGMINTRLIDSNQHKIVSRWQFTAGHGYPTPSKERDQLLEPVQEYLEGLPIYSRGRFGAWKYEVSNQDHSFMQGVEWVDRMINGKEEKTFHGKV